MIVVAEKYFEGDMSDKEPIGEIFQVIALEPYFPGGGVCCCLNRVPVRHSIKPLQNMKNPSLVPAISLIPLLLSNQMQNFCFCFKSTLITYYISFA